MAYIKAVIFDIDGTLVDSVDFHAEAWQRAFHEFGRDIPFTDIRQQIGKGGDQLLPHFLGDEADSLGKRIGKRRSEIYKSEYLPRVKPFPGVRALFERIRSDRKKIALASSSQEDELDFYKKLLHIEDLLQHDTSADDAEKSKPHPDIFEAALSGLRDVGKNEALIVGDTPWDAEAANRAGIAVIGFLCGGFPEKQLRGAGCREIYRDPAHLLSAYTRSSIAAE